MANVHKKALSAKLYAGYKQGGIPVTEETETVFQCVGVDLSPVFSDKGRYQQKQRAVGVLLG